MILLNYKDAIHKHLFEHYEHSQSIISAHLEGIFPYELYVDNIDNPVYGILYTEFDYHFTFGEVDSDVLTENIRSHIKKHHLSEAIILTPDGSKNDSLDKLIKNFSGVIDKRYFFTLNNTLFEEFSNEVDTSDILITKEKFMNSNTSFLKATYMENDVEIGYSKFISVGSNFGEIDVFTSESHRNKGVATKTTVALINECLKHNINPLWTCWAQKKESIKLANKLGFKKKLTLSAYVWVQDFLEIK